MSFSEGLGSRKIRVLETIQGDILSIRKALEPVIEGKQTLSISQKLESEIQKLHRDIVKAKGSSYEEVRSCGEDLERGFVKKDMPLTFDELEKKGALDLYFYREYALFLQEVELSIVSTLEIKNPTSEEK